MEILLLFIVVGVLQKAIFGESKKDERLREWRKHNPDYIDVLRG